jgi:hypothetical protein
MQKYGMFTVAAFLVTINVDIPLQRRRKNDENEIESLAPLADQPYFVTGIVLYYR